MRLFHFSDTHLGHQQYPRTDAGGLNQREQDIEAAFRTVVDLAVAQRPDLVIHAGDLFDGVRPSNRALAAALEGFLRLSQAGIPTVVIAGNHEHPKLRETGSAFRLFGHLPGIHPVYQGARQAIDVTTRSGQTVRVHAVPQCPDNEALAREIAAIRRGLGPPLADVEVLVAHGAVTSLEAFSHAEFNEQSLDPAWFDARFDYVALGHFHGTKQVAPNAWYCGAPERVSIAEAGEEKGFLDVTLQPRGQAAPVPPAVTFHPLAGRLYADLPPIEADGLDGPGLIARAVAAVARTPAGAVARLRVRGIGAQLRGSLDLRQVQEAGKHLLHLDLSKWDFAHADTNLPGPEAIGSLGDEFTRFAAHTALREGEREALVLRARHALAGPIPEDEADAPSPSAVASVLAKPVEAALTAPAPAGGA